MKNNSDDSNSLILCHILDVHITHSVPHFFADTLKQSNKEYFYEQVRFYLNDTHI